MRSHPAGDNLMMVTPRVPPPPAVAGRSRPPVEPVPGHAGNRPVLRVDGGGTDRRVAARSGQASGRPMDSKYSRVTLNTIGASSSTPIRFGIAINPLRVSVRFHTRLTFTLANVSAAALGLAGNPLANAPAMLAPEGWSHGMARRAPCHLFVPA